MAAAPTPPLALPSSRRIKQGRDFARARTQGRRLVQGCLIMNWFVLPPGAPSRVGVITTRRLGDAPVRSRARRLMREAFRTRQHGLAQPADVVLVARPSIVGRPFRDVERDLVAALRKAGLWRETTGQA
jgi:ribonuclease P protein component